MSAPAPRGLPSRAEFIARARRSDAELAELHRILTAEGYRSALAAARAMVDAARPERPAWMRHAHAREAVRAARAWGAGDRAGWRENADRAGDRHFAGRPAPWFATCLPLVVRDHDLRAPKAPGRLP